MIVPCITPPNMHVAYVSSKIECACLTSFCHINCHKAASHDRQKLAVVTQ